MFIIQCYKLLSHILKVKWRPTIELVIVILSWAAVVGGMWLAFQCFTTDRVALNFITFGPVTLFGLGVAVPLLWALYNRRSPAAVGITGRHALISITLGFVFFTVQYSITLANVDLPPLHRLVPLLVMSLSVGFFEAVFFRGWMQLRFEEAFGVLPGIVLGAGFYALYHVGYGMAWGEMGTLFIIGLIYAAVFRLTSNVLILWPLFTPSGALFSHVSEGLVLPFEATYGFVIVLLMMLLAIILAKKGQAFSNFLTTISKYTVIIVRKLRQA